MYLQRMEFLIFLVGFCCIAASAFKFTSDIYFAQVATGDGVGVRLQQVVAIPDKSGQVAIRYEIQENEFIGLNESTGDISLKRSLGEHDLAYGLKLVIYAFDTKTSVNATASLNVSKIMPTATCSCFQQAGNLSIVLPENAWLPFGLMFLQPSSSKCLRNYTIQGDKKFKVVDGRLLVDPLDFESAASRTRTSSVTCNGERRALAVTVQDPFEHAPYILTVDGKRQRLEENITLYPATYSAPPKKVLSFMDADATLANLRSVKMNDPEDLLTLGPIQQDTKIRNVFSMDLTWAERLPIENSTYIDVKVIDDGIDPADLNGLSNTITWRYNIFYKLNEVQVQLKNFDRLNVSRGTQYATTVFQVDDDLARSMLFELRASDEKCAQFLNVTRHDGIIYVNNDAALRVCENSPVDYELLISTAQIVQTISFQVLLHGEPPAKPSPAVKCSSHVSQLSCEAGPGIGTDRCLWKRVELNSSNYSSCVPNSRCSNQLCDELERQTPGMCPQDCSVGWKGNHKSICSPLEGICQGHGICFCQGRYCQCQSADTQMITEDDEPSDGTLDPFLRQPSKEQNAEYDSICGYDCMISVCVIGILSLLSITILFVWYYRRTIQRRRKGEGISAWRISGNDLNLSLTSSPDYDGSTPTTNVSMLSDWSDGHPYHNTGNMELHDPAWELPREWIQVNSYIGEGEFGRVMKAKVKNSADSSWTLAAVKMLKDGACRAEYLDLMSEYNLLKEVDHPNVIKLYGAATRDGPFYLIVEYCEHGSLKNYLRKILTEDAIYVNGCTEFYARYAAELLTFSWQISKGMQYLSDLKLVHRDLAARNILIASGMVVKISDFGMTKDVYEEDAYKKKGQGRIPVKWMAPESLYHQVYTSKSDVWSFGIVLWEIVTLGATPYPGIPAERMYQLLQEGYRMDRPDSCSPALYTIMQHCWEFEPARRPTFRDLRHFLEAMIADKMEYLDLTVAHAHRFALKDSLGDNDSDEGGATTVLLSSHEIKSADDYLVSRVGRPLHSQTLRYTTLDLEEE